MDPLMALIHSILALPVGTLGANNILLTALVLMASIGSPLLLSWLTNRARRREKQEDFLRDEVIAARQRKERLEDLARQDQVSTRTAEATKLLAITNKQVAENADVTHSKLDAIHVLVNSNMTAAMQAELDATKRELLVLREVVTMKVAAGHSPDPDTLAAIEIAQTHISELEARIKDRLNPQ